MAQITSVTSESLQAKIRELLPSQQGFGEDLQAQNVIVPVIDLTAAAEGSSTPQYLQTALAFGSQTAFSASNSTAVIANSPGFYRIFAGVSKTASSGGTIGASFTMTDGLSTKTIWALETGAIANTADSLVLDFTVFLAAGDSISCGTNNAACFIKGSVRQVADVNGTLVNPSGFTPQ